MLTTIASTHAPGGCGSWCSRQHNRGPDAGAQPVGVESHAASAPASPTPRGDLIRIGLIGTGGMGRDHAARIATRVGGARLAAVCDADTGLATRTADAIAECRVEEDPFALIAAQDVDAVLVATPGETHEALVLACLERDLPVLCEKPLTPTSAAALRVVESEVALGHRRVQVGFMRRFDAQYAQLHDTLAARTLGAPVMLHCVHRVASMPDWFTQEMVTSDALVHEFDVTRWLLGQEIDTISVLHQRDPGTRPDGPPTPQLAIFRMSDSVLVDVEIYVSCGYGYEVRCEAVCEQGTMTIGTNAGPLVRHAGRWGGEITQDFQSRFALAYDREVQAWVDSTRSGRATGPSAWDGYAAAAAADAAGQAQQDGGWVPVQINPRPPLYR
jgi:myo-inositol 2-dehydrogenase/D-chiro-inositol 1-dehydrogenase